MNLLLYTGQRRGDVIRLGRQHIRDGLVHLFANFFGQIVKPDGKFDSRCNEAGLSNCSAHELRKTAARRLAEAGCTMHEIAAITGNVSLSEVQRYTKAADQKRLASSAMEKAK